MKLGDTNTHLFQFEAILWGNSLQQQPLTKSILVLMVHGLSSTLAFPYKQFAYADVTSALLMDLVWEAISRLERQGI